MDAWFLPSALCKLTKHNMNRCMRCNATRLPSICLLTFSLPLHPGTLLLLLLLLLLLDHHVLQPPCFSTVLTPDPSTGTIQHGYLSSVGPCMSAGPIGSNGLMIPHTPPPCCFISGLLPSPQRAHTSFSITLPTRLLSDLSPFSIHPIPLSSVRTKFLSVNTAWRCADIAPFASFVHLLYIHLRSFLIKGQENCFTL